MIVFNRLQYANSEIAQDLFAFKYFPAILLSFISNHGLRKSLSTSDYRDKFESRSAVCRRMRQGGVRARTQDYTDDSSDKRGR